MHLIWTLSISTSRRWGAPLETSPLDMTSTPRSSFSSLAVDDTVEDYLFAHGTGLSDPACTGVVKRRRMLELVKRLRNAGWVDRRESMGSSISRY